ncbi:MAG: hypothetical protein R6U70_09410 [Bacillota bacterium]|jgi:hypothetical protein
MMTPVFLTPLILFHPRVNIVTMRVTALAGVIIGLYNLLVNFGLERALLWWMGILHIPLLLISGHALVLSYRTRPSP